MKKPNEMTPLAASPSHSPLTPGPTAIVHPLPPPSPEQPKGRPTGGAVTQARL